MTAVTAAELVRIREHYERMLEVNPRPRTWEQYLAKALEQVEIHRRLEDERIPRRRP